MPKVNFNPQGTLIQDEALFVPPQSHITGTKFKLSHDVFSSVDFSITYNGEALVPQVDYVLTDVYERARQEMGLTVYQRVQFLPNAPLGFTSTVYVTYRAVGDFVDADNYMNIEDGDDRYCKKINNLSDVNADSAILNLIQSASSIRDDAVRDDTEIPCFTGSAYAQGSHFGKVSLLKIFNNWLKSKFQSWFGITVTESDGSITGRSFDGNAARTSNAITFSNSGDGAASGSTFDGSAAQTLSYNSIGAQAALTQAQLDAVNSKITTPAVMPRAIAETPSGDPPYSHTVYYTGGSVSSFISQGEAFLAVFDEMTISSATYWKKTSGSANRNGGRLNGVALPSTPMTLPSGIYLVAVHNDAMKNIYSLDYLLDKILNPSS